MSGSVRQYTRVGRNSNTRITNTYSRKRGRITNLPRNGKVVFEKGFARSDLKERIAQLKSSPQYKSGETKSRAEYKQLTLKKGQTLVLKSKNLRVRASTS